MKDVAKTIAIGVSGGLFALAIAQAQPGCDAGGTEKAAPAKAEAKPEAKAETKPEAKPAEPVVDDAATPTLVAPPKDGEPMVEPAADPEAEAAAIEAEAKAEPDAKKKRNNAGKRTEERPDAKVFLPATKSGAFIPPKPQPQQQQQQAPNAPANQE